jgi:hypothetical protein
LNAAGTERKIPLHFEACKTKVDSVVSTEQKEKEKQQLIKIINLIVV